MTLNTNSVRDNEETHSSPTQKTSIPASQLSEQDQKVDEKAQSKRSIKKLKFTFILYSLLKSIKPSSSYITKFISCVDSELGTQFTFKINPVAQWSQMIFFVLVVLFSAQLGFDKILHLDYITSLTNLIFTLCILHPFFRLRTLQMGSFVYGISNATSQAFHSFVYTLFDREMYQKMSGYTKAAGMFGHAIGAIFGFLLVKFLANEESYIVKKIHKIDMNSLSYLDQVAFVEQMDKQSKTRKKWIYSFLIIITIATAFGSMIVQWWFPRMTKEEREKSKKKANNISSIVKCVVLFKKREVFFWSASYALAFMTMLSSKTWCGSFWHKRQDQTHSEPWNGLFDFFAYFSGAIGSLMPAKIVDRFGPKAGIVSQLVICLICAVATFVQTLPMPFMHLYYALHSVICLCVYFSISFMMSELAKCIDHSHVKLLTFVVNFFCFTSQVVINMFIEGFSYSKSLDESDRYLILTAQMTISFFVMLIGFVGNTPSAKNGACAEKEKAKHLEEASSTAPISDIKKITN